MLPGTRVGGREGGKGRALGSLLSTSSLLPTTRPASSGLCSPAQAATSRRDQRTEPGRGSGGMGDYGRCRLFPASRANPKRMEKEERRTEGRTWGGSSGRRREESRRKTREKEHGQASRLTGTWHTSCYSLQWAPPGRLIAGACLSVCLSAAPCEAHRLGWGVWLGHTVQRPEVLLPASRTQPPGRLGRQVGAGGGTH